MAMLAQKRRFNVTDLCEKFEIAERTAYEDLRYMKENMGLQIEHNNFTDSYYLVSPYTNHATFELTEGEFFSLIVGKQLLEKYTGSSFEPIISTALEKIRDRLSDKIDLDIDETEKKIAVKPVATTKFSKKKFDAINDACEEKQSLEICYYAPSTGEKTSRLIDPFKLLHHDGAWYVIAWCHLRKDLRMFALHRIEEYKAQTSSQYNDLPKEVIDDYINSTFKLEHKHPAQVVKVKFSSKQSPYIKERNWHPQEYREDLADGSCVLTLPTKSLDEMKRWLMTYGKEAEVLEPNELKELIKTEADALLKHYLKEIEEKEKEKEKGNS
jgi:predicted DNA-binding transcriptional regulator YafY